MELVKAKAIADYVVDVVSPFCDRVKIAGSVRRGKAEVKDIEIVAIPRPCVDLFGAPTSGETELDGMLRFLVEQGEMSLLKNGPRYKQAVLTPEGYPGGKAGINLDLFLVLPPAQWGVILAIRTGPADFSHWMVTPRCKGGGLPSEYQVRDGGVYLDGSLIEMPGEADLFKLLGMDWVEPGERQAGWAIFPHPPALLPRGEGGRI